MAITHVASLGVGSGITSFTIALSASILADDLLLVNVTEKLATADPTVTDNDGGTWTKLTSGATSGDTAWGSIWYRYATSATASKTVTVTFSVDLALGCGGYSSYRGTALSSPFENLSSQQNESGVETHTGFTPSRNGSLICLNVIQGGANAVSAEACTDPGVLAERFDSASAGAARCTHASEVQAIAGATGNLTWAQTNAAGRSIVFDILPPAPAGAGIIRNVGLNTGLRIGL